MIDEILLFIGICIQDDIYWVCAADHWYVVLGSLYSLLVHITDRMSPSGAPACRASQARERKVGTVHSHWEREKSY